MKKYLLIPKIQILNANAEVTPYIVGFPPMTAWLGSVHFLERKLKEENLNISFNKIAVSVFGFKADLYRGQNDFYSVIIGRRNPLGYNKNPPFVESPTCSLTVSLLIEMESENENEETIKKIQENFLKMKIAGGDIIKLNPIKILTITEENKENDTRKILRTLMPGFVLIERSDLLEKEENNDSLENLLSYLRVTFSKEKETEVELIQENKEENKELISKEIKNNYEMSRKTDGWIVPISIGFKDLGESNGKNRRDISKEHHFVEPVVTLGEFKMPYKFNTIDEILWRYEYQEENKLYLTKNQK